MKAPALRGGFFFYGGNPRNVCGMTGVVGLTSGMLVPMSDLFEGAICVNYKSSPNRELPNLENTWAFVVTNTPEPCPDQPHTRNIGSQSRHFCSRCWSCLSAPIPGADSVGPTASDTAVGTSTFGCPCKCDCLASRGYPTIPSPLFRRICRRKNLVPLGFSA